MLPRGQTLGYSSPSPTTLDLDKSSASVLMNHILWLRKQRLGHGNDFSGGLYVLGTEPARLPLYSSPFLLHCEHP